MSKKLDLIELSKRDILKVKGGSIVLFSSICQCPNGAWEMDYNTTYKKTNDNFYNEKSSPESDD